MRKQIFPWLSTWVKWGLLLPLILLNGWAALQLFDFFQSELTAIITATLLSFLLAYPVRGLRQRFGVRHHLAVAFVATIAFFCFFVIAVTLIPLVVDQFTGLSSRFPDWINSGKTQLDAFDAWAIAHKFPLSIDRLTQQIESTLSTQVQPLSSILLHLFPSAFEEVFHWILVLILTLYLLLHGDRFWDGIFRWLPPWGQRLRETTRQTFQNYFVGQLTLAVIVAIAMTIAFLVLKIPFALVFGLAVGVLALFPLGKTIGVIVISGLVSLQSIWLGLRVAGVAIVIDQFIENFISPILISRFTALNPIWILMSLLFGVKIAGLLGLVLAVPIAGTVKALLNPPPLVLEPSPEDIDQLISP